MATCSKHGRAFQCQSLEEIAASATSELPPTAVGTPSKNGPFPSLAAGWQACGLVSQRSATVLVSKAILGNLHLTSTTAAATAAAMKAPLGEAAGEEAATAAAAAASLSPAVPDICHNHPSSTRAAAAARIVRARPPVPPPRSQLQFPLLHGLSKGRILTHTSSSSSSSRSSRAPMLLANLPADGMEARATYTTTTTATATAAAIAAVECTKRGAAKGMPGDGRDKQIISKQSATTSAPAPAAGRANEVALTGCGRTANVRQFNSGLGLYIDARLPYTTTTPAAAAAAVSSTPGVGKGGARGGRAKQPTAAAAAEPSAARPPAAATAAGSSVSADDPFTRMLQGCNLSAAATARVLQQLPSWPSLSRNPAMVETRIRALQELLGFSAADGLLTVAPEALTRVPTGLRAQVEELGRVLGVGAEGLGPLLVKCWELSKIPLEEVEERVDWVGTTLGFNEGLGFMEKDGAAEVQEQQLGRKRAKPPALKAQVVEGGQAAVGETEGVQGDWGFRFFSESPVWLIYEQTYLERQLGKVREVMGFTAEQQGNRGLARVLWEAPALITLQGLQKRVQHVQLLLDAWPSQQQQQQGALADRFTPPGAEGQAAAGAAAAAAAAAAMGRWRGGRSKSQQQQQQQQGLGLTYAQQVCQRFPRLLLLPPKQLTQLCNQLQLLLPGLGPEQLFPILSHRQPQPLDQFDFNIDQVNINFDQVKYLQQLGLLDGLQPEEQQQAVVNALVKDATAFAESERLYPAWSATQQLLAVAPSSWGLTKCYNQLLEEQGLTGWLEQMEGKWGRVLCLLGSSSSLRGVGYQGGKKGAGFGRVGLRQLAQLSVEELLANLQPASNSSSTSSKKKSARATGSKRPPAATAAAAAAAGSSGAGGQSDGSSAAAAAAWELLPPPLLTADDSSVWQLLAAKAAERQAAIAAGQQLWQRLQQFADSSSSWQQQLREWQVLLPDALVLAREGSSSSSSKVGGLVGMSSGVGREGRVGASSFLQQQQQQQPTELLPMTLPKQQQQQQQQEEDQQQPKELLLMTPLQQQQQGELHIFWQGLLHEQQQRYQQQQQSASKHQLLGPSLQRLQYLDHTQQQQQIPLWWALAYPEHNFTSRFPLYPLWLKTASWVQGKQSWEDMFWGDLKGEGLLGMLGLLKRDTQRVKRLEYLVSGREVGREEWRGIGLKEAVEMDQQGFVELFPEAKYRAWQMLNRLEVQTSAYGSSAIGAAVATAGGGSGGGGNGDSSGGVESPGTSPRGVWRVTEQRHQELADRCQTLIHFAAEVPHWDIELQKWTTSNWWYLAGIFTPSVKQPRLEHLSLLPEVYQMPVEWVLKASDVDFCEKYPHFPLWNKMRGVVAGNVKWGRQLEQLKGEELLRVLDEAVAAVGRGAGGSSSSSSGSGRRVAAAVDGQWDSAAAASVATGIEDEGINAAAAVSGGGGGGAERGADVDVVSTSDDVTPAAAAAGIIKNGLGEAAAATVKAVAAPEATQAAAAAAAAYPSISTRSQVAAALPMIIKRLQHMLRYRAAESLTLTEALTMAQSDFLQRYPKFNPTIKSSSSSSSSSQAAPPEAAATGGGDFGLRDDPNLSDIETTTSRSDSSGIFVEGQASSSSSSSRVVTNPSGKFGPSALPDEIWSELSGSVQQQLLDRDGALLKGLAVFANSHPAWKEGMGRIGGRGWERMVQCYERGYRKADFIVR